MPSLLPSLQQTSFSPRSAKDTTAISQVSVATTTLPPRLSTVRLDPGKKWSDFGGGLRGIILETGQVRASKEYNKNKPDKKHFVESITVSGDGDTIWVEKEYPGEGRREQQEYK